MSVAKGKKWSWMRWDDNLKVKGNWGKDCHTKSNDFYWMSVYKSLLERKRIERTKIDRWMIETEIEPQATGRNREWKERKMH